ncbi:MAG TPA: tetratricopeptide repeat protein [Acidobacteriaceae bacterium]
MTLAFAMQPCWAQAPSGPAPSPAEQRIASAQRQIAADPHHAQAYNELALALVRRARETSAPGYLAQAQAALDAGLHLAPQDFQLAKTKVALLLARGQFPEALSNAQKLNRQTPDDVTVYGFVAEADLALGNYPEAEKAVQWMLNLRPNNTPGLLLGAELRLLYGDTPGAVEFFHQAFDETPPTEVEELAHIANRMAAAELGSGQLEAAAQALARAEELFPHYPAAMPALARLRMGQQRPGEAVAVLQTLALQEQQTLKASTSSTLLLLATAEAQAGNAEAPATFARFEQAARAEALTPSHDDTLLILYDAGLPGHPAANALEALRLAARQAAMRHDYATLDAYAWALYANGRYAEAETQIAAALAPGLHSAQLEEHAGAIAMELHQPAEAAVRFAAAVQADSTSPYAAEARSHLGAGLGAATGALAAVATTAPAASPAPGRALTPSVRSDDVPLNEVTDTGSVPAALLVPRPTSTARTLRRMQGLVAANPSDAQAYAGLGAAFNQRARETGDVEDFNLAEQALTKSLDLVSSDLSASAPLQTLAAVCMGEHRFKDAVVYAQKALALGSGDLTAFAILGDAFADMGQYEKAGSAYSRLQTGTAASAATYARETRTAYLTFLAGNTKGAIDEMRASIGEALRAQLPAENLAWLYYELGEFRYQDGQVQAAADAYLTALTIYPGDYRALAGLGKVRACQRRWKDAIVLYQAAIAVVPMPLYIAELGDIHAATGDAAEAEKQYKLVEYIGRLGHINQVLHNRDLALFYADHDRNLPEALSLAQKEFEVRSDVYTWDALAWALYKNSRYADADEAMAHALRLGTRDATLLFHAGMISAALGHRATATAQLEQALSSNPRFHVLYASLATQQLTVLQAAPQSSTATFAHPSAAGQGASGATHAN